MQEPVQSLGVGSVPRSIIVILEDDLVDTSVAFASSEERLRNSCLCSCKAGDDVIITGVVIHRWAKAAVGKR